jgi:hypothetical protein
LPDSCKSYVTINLLSSDDNYLHDLAQQVSTSRIFAVWGIGKTIMDKGEIVLYRPQSDDIAIDVLVEDETVWLTQAQMAELFVASKQSISRHINNIIKGGELQANRTVKESLTVQIEGDRKVQRKIIYYNLDMIISIGYRVKSQRGIEFRIWVECQPKRTSAKAPAVLKCHQQTSERPK